MCVPSCFPYLQYMKLYYSLLSILCRMYFMFFPFWHHTLWTNNFVRAVVIYIDHLITYGNHLLIYGNRIITYTVIKGMEYNSSHRFSNIPYQFLHWHTSGSRHSLCPTFPFAVADDVFPVDLALVVCLLQRLRFRQPLLGQPMPEAGLVRCGAPFKAASLPSHLNC